MNKKIALYDADSEHIKNKSFPNYALMKISAYHKKNKDIVEWFNRFDELKYDVIYSSKIFDFTDRPMFLSENVITGGTGYNIKKKLPQIIDNMFPDYSIYPKCDYAIGFIPRGCIRKCRWCVVPEKEGYIQPYREWKDLIRKDTNKLVLMDNNILASDYGINQLSQMIGRNIKIDLNQGMDARLVTSEIAEMLSRLNWIKYIRFSCDTKEQIESIVKVYNLFKKYGVKPYRMFVYFLVTTDLEDASIRINELRKLSGITVYAQAERNSFKEIIPNKEQLEFAQRYVYSGVWRKESFNDYCKRNANMSKKSISATQEQINVFELL